MIPAEDASRRRGVARRHLALAAVAASVTAVDLTAKSWAQTGLSTAGVEAGPVDLRLAYNPGVAFSLGAEAPAGLIIAVTAVITAAVAVYAWRTASQGTRGQLAALALILGGAVANLADRAADGVVTDYLHTGWWPTFNLADTAIVTGGLLFTITTWRSDVASNGLPIGGKAEQCSTEGSTPRPGSAPSAGIQEEPQCPPGGQPSQCEAAETAVNHHRPPIHP